MTKAPEVCVMAYAMNVHVCVLVSVSDSLAFLLLCVVRRGDERHPLPSPQPESASAPGAAGGAAAYLGSRLSRAWVGGSRPEVSSAVSRVASAPPTLAHNPPPTIRRRLFI